MSTSTIQMSGNGSKPPEYPSAVLILNNADGTGSVFDFPKGVFTLTVEHYDPFWIDGYSRPTSRGVREVRLAIHPTGPEAYTYTRYEKKPFRHLWWAVKKLLGVTR